MLLEIGARGNLIIRHHHFPFASPKTTLLYVSDLHLSGQTAHIVRQVMRTVQDAQPQVVLLGGDMVDSERGFAELTSLIWQIRAICPVWAISGNHERYVGVDKVRACVEFAQGNWLDESSFCLTTTTQIDGTCHSSTSRSWPQRFRSCCSARRLLCMLSTTG